MTSRERVYATLDFELPEGERVPRQMWVLPWADENHPGSREALLKEFPEDIAHAPGYFTSPVNERTVGGMFKVGTYIDEWGCIFENRQSGIIGEVKTPIVDDWEDTRRVHLPEEALTVDVGQVNAFCGATDQFVIAGACQRPFERLQFIRGTENLYVDLALEEEGLTAFMKQMHEFHLKELEVWSRTDVDALFIMDDWGTQKSLLINPEMWRRVFKPLYKDYIDLAHAAGKKIFMHSDGYILDILPDLIELGLDAINSQIFCMGPEKLAAFKGQITFWGEMDRQHILPEGTPEEVNAAVASVYESLYAQGGVIAQCEFGPGAKPENIQALYAAWNRITS
ncbi:uroporphyrinogen decarboxylase family protein [Pontiellaceae bacterium B12227]|nr:uroporphyrinogen decarboxylase family protein [Pontiellaceae bacterium B12227]